jgi:hypothetical protein
VSNHESKDFLVTLRGIVTKHLEEEIKRNQIPLSNKAYISNSLPLITHFFCEHLCFTLFVSATERTSPYTKDDLWQSMDDQLSKAHSTQQVLYMVLSQFVN